MKTLMLRLMATTLACACLIAAPVARGQTYPDKSVRIVVPYPPGGGADILARAIGQKLGAQWGQTVVIDNKAGAGGSIGTDAVAKASPDGYTLLMASPSHAINNSLYKNLAFDAEKNFYGVVLAASGPLVLVVNASSPYKTVADFIAAARARPSGINYASAGIGSSPHLAGELFALMAGVCMLVAVLLLLCVATGLMISTDPTMAALGLAFVPLAAWTLARMGFSQPARVSATIRCPRQERPAVVAAKKTSLGE